MLKKSRIKKDTQFLKQNGYKRIRLTKSYDYFKDWNLAAMVYNCKKDGQFFEQVIIDKEYDFKTIYKDKVKREIEDYDVLHVKQDIDTHGIVYNLVMEKDNTTYLGFFSYDVKNRILRKRIMPIEGEPNENG